MTLKARALRILLIVTLLAVSAYAFRGRLIHFFFRPDPPPARQTGLLRSQLGSENLEVVAERLEVPWAMTFLPDGSLLITERPGRLVHIVRGERHRYGVPGVRQAGEGGLMGLALHPDFDSNRFIYVCLTAEAGDGLENRVERYRFDAGLADRRVIVDGIPGAHYHDGCRLEFGPDGLLYVTTGDAGRPAAAQDLSSPSGKILRVTPEGEVPEDNPFGSRVYSYGHRNPQGLAWDEEGRLWSTEHGPSGGASGFDELNLIEPGGNYGWPQIRGDESAVGMVTPTLQSGPDYTWAPSGAAYWEGRIFFGGLRGEALYEARITGPGAPALRVHFHGEFGRIRPVRLGPDGRLYFGTSNRDGRGRSRSGDDRIIGVDPEVFR